MIIKIENYEQNGYYYAEGERLEYQVLPMNKTIQLYQNKEALWLINPENEFNEKLITMIFHIYKNLECRVIITTRQTFILNENGKTIDRLF